MEIFLNKILLKSTPEAYKACKEFDKFSGVTIAMTKEVVLDIQL